MADRQLGRIHDQMKQLCRQPGIGAPREQFAKGLRVGLESPYGIYYIASATELTVIASCMARGISPPSPREAASTQPVPGMI